VPADLRVLADRLDLLFDLATDAADLADDQARAFERAGEHPAVVGGAYRVRDHLRHALGLIGAASGKYGAVRALADPELSPRTLHVPAERADLPTEGERAGVVYLDRHAPAQGDHGPLCRCGHTPAVHVRPDGLGHCAAPSGSCDCVQFTARRQRAR
jgi:hypothetical protein